MASENTPLRIVRILVVGKSPENTVDSLSILGHTVRACREAADVLEIATEFKPHIALLDLEMPGIEGHSLAWELRGLHTIRRISLTGHKDGPYQIQDPNYIEGYSLDPEAIREINEVLGRAWRPAS